MKTYTEKFIFPTLKKRKVFITATMVDNEDGSKPRIHVKFRNNVERMVLMTDTDYLLLDKMLSAIFTGLQNGKTIDQVLSKVVKEGGPKIPLKEKLAIAKRSWKRAKQHAALIE